MRRALHLSPLLLLPGIALAQICPWPVTIRGTVGCPVGTPGCAAVSRTLTGAETEKDLLNILALCNVNGEDFPTECEDGEVLTAADGALVCSISGSVPEGPAGGDLFGSYPDPSVSNDSHTHTAATLPSASALGAPATHGSSHAQGQSDALSGTLAVAVTGNAGTATQLAANPTDCGASLYATSIDASGNLGCSALPAGITGPETSTARALSLWGDTSGLALVSSGVTLGSTAENRLIWGNGAGVFESGTGLWLKPAGSADSGIELSAAGHLGWWIVSNGPTVRMVGTGSNPAYSFTLNQDTGMGMSAPGELYLKAGGVAGFVLTTTSASILELQLVPQAAPSAACDSSLRGRMYYDTSDAYCGCDGTTWNKFSGAAGGTCS